QTFGGGVLFQQLPENLTRMAQERQVKTLFSFDQSLVRDREQPSHDEHRMGMGETEIVKERSEAGNPLFRFRVNDPYPDHLHAKSGPCRSGKDLGFEIIMRPPELQPVQI